MTSSVWRRRLCCWWYLSFYTPNPSESRLNTLLFTSRTILPGSDFLRVSFILNYTSLSFSFSTLLFQLRSMKTSGLLLSSYFLQFCCCSKWHKYPASAETKRCFAVKKKNKKSCGGPSVLLNRWLWPDSFISQSLWYRETLAVEMGLLLNRKLLLSFSSTCSFLSYPSPLSAAGVQ